MNTVLWRGTSSNHLLAWFVTALCAVLSIFTIFANQYARPEKQLQGANWIWFFALMMIVPVIGLVFSRLEVVVHDKGVVIGFGPAGWPKGNIKWDDVVTVELINVRPTEWGGWGYRWVPWKRATAAVMHAGEGLHFTFANGKQFVVTVDGASEALEVIRKVIAKLPSSN